MAAFRTNHQNTQQNTLMDAGEYELVIMDVTERTTTGGTPYVSVHSVVRNDVQQKYQNKHVYDSLWMSPGAAPYSEQKINAIDKVLENPEAAYESHEAWGQTIRGRAIRAKIGPSKASPGYEPRDQVKSYMATRFPTLAHVFQAPAATATTTVSHGDTMPGGFTPVSDDELPF